MSKKTCLFTICSRNYLHYARTLMESARQHAPNVHRYVALCDVSDGFEPIEKDLLSIISLHELEIPGLDDMISKYTVMELNTAIKPSVFLHLFQRRGYDKVVYFDPDISLYSGMDELLDMLDDNDIVLTPHLTAPIEDNRHPGEVTFLQCGAYNLGFIATARTHDTERLMRWWTEKLADQCSVDLPHGLFVDQKWIDLVPGFFDRVFICRDPGWNVAYWNLHSRALAREGQRLSVNDRPLFFFHYSGITPDGLVFSKHQDRFSMSNLDPAVRELAGDYCAALRRNGAEAYSQIRYGYGRFASGLPIPDFIRRIYREHAKLAEKLGSLTSAGGERSWMGYALEVPTGYNILNRASLALYEMRIDLSNAFPDVPLGNELPYANWFSDNGSVQPDMLAEFVAPVRHRLEKQKKSLAPPAGVPAAGAGRRTAAVWMYRLIYQMAWRMQRLVYPFTSMAARRRIHDFLVNLAYSRKTVRLPAGHAHRRPPGLNVIGYLKAESGVGRAAQLTIDAALACQIPLALRHFSMGCVSRLGAELPAGVAEGNPHDINLFHINADQMPIVRSQLDPELFSGRYNIGFWYWELPEFPSEWQSSFQQLDEIWVASTFCQQSIAKSSPIPVVMMPPGISASPDPRCDRAYFGLPKDAFIFLTMADGLSFIQRKNTLGTIEAFRRAFPNKASGVKLVVKMINGAYSGSGYEQVRQAIEGDPSIVLVDQYMCRSEVDSLIAASDAIVSLHRSEGFGLPLAEAMLMGKPAIATGWSANTDFMTNRNAFLVDFRIVEIDKDHGPYKAGMHWSDPDLDDAAKAMQFVFANDIDVRLRAQRAKADMVNYYSPAIAGRLIGDRLAYIRNYLIN